MELRDLKTLSLLEAIDGEEYQSQRALSKKLNMSLGLVNTFIKNLTNQGIFETSKLSNNRVRYILSPQGVVKKANLTKQYLSYSISYYNEIKKRIEETLKRLEKQGGKKFVFYGSGELCEIACMIFSDNNNGKKIIVDNDKAGRKICGQEILEEAVLKDEKFDAIIIMDFNNISNAKKKLTALGVSTDKIFSV